MNNFNEDYYLLFVDPAREEYNLREGAKTANTEYDYKELNYGSAPLQFSSKTSDLNFADSEYEVFFTIGSIVVTDKIKDLIGDKLYGSKFYPAIIKGKQEGVREDVWALNIFNRLDCWDRTKSIASYPGGMKSIEGIDYLASVKSFSLSEDILEKIPEEDRLLFVMDNTDVTNIFIHKKIVDIFKKNNVKGSKFFKVSQYRFGMEF